MHIVLEELERNKLFFRNGLQNECIRLLHHTKTDEEVITSWLENLNLPKEKFKCFKAKAGRNPYRFCHIYISDVRLRRVIDIIHEEFFLQGTKNRMF